jgi:hypothetical protein
VLVLADGHEAASGVRPDPIGGKHARVRGAEPPGESGQDRPVGPGLPGRTDLALQDGDLVAQQRDLDVLGVVGAGQQGQPAAQPREDQVSRRKVTTADRARARAGPLLLPRDRSGGRKSPAQAQMARFPAPTDSRPLPEDAGHRLVAVSSPAGGVIV